MKNNVLVWCFVGAALLGLVFNAFSTADFVGHLDRQVHAIHCSFVPGLAAMDASASSGCHTALMSPYSSVLRKLVWGGLPMSLLGMGVFAFLAFRGVELLANRRTADRGAAFFLFGATLVPVLTSVVMGSIAVFELGATCKLCIGIYVSSVASMGFAGALWWSLRRVPQHLIGDEGEAEPPAAAVQGARGHAIGVGEGVLFVAVPALLYLAMVPDHGRYAGTCGELAQPELPAGVLVPLDPHPGAKVAIEVFDPLCGACKGFEERLVAAGLDAQLDRKAVLFPLDASCNWMVGTSLHPGACAVSEAVLCAGDAPGPVVDWAFANQEAILEAAKADPAAAARMVKEAFPALGACVGSNSVRQRLNRSLRWAVKNQLPVLTPQLYVDGRKLCDEDTDLGLDFALSRLLDEPLVAEAMP